MTGTPYNSIGEAMGAAMAHNARMAADMHASRAAQEWDSAEWRCGRCGAAVYAKTQDGLIRSIARHKLDCPPTTTPED